MWDRCCGSLILAIKEWKIAAFDATIKIIVGLKVG